MKTVLIVEDEIIISFSLKILLGRKDFKVAELTRTGEEALTAFKRHNPDIILMDINLKGIMSGLDTAREILQIGKPRIIFISAYKKEEVVTDGELMNLEFLKKPLDEDNLFELLAS